MMSKPKINAKHAPVIRAVKNYMQRSQLFGGALSGGYNFADTKHDKSWKDYGWPEQVDFFMLWNMFRRNGYAFAGVTLPVEMCWLTKPWVQQNDKEDSDNETPYEVAFKKEAARTDLWPVLKDADMMQRVGRYAGIYVTVADNKTPDKAVTGRNNRVVSFKPLFEGQLEPNTWNKDRSSKRFGLPETYTLNESGTGNRNPYATTTGTIHHSRVIIQTEDALGTDIYGIPALEPGFNALLNLQKIQGAGGEGFWRQAAQKFVMESTDENGGDYSDEEVEALSQVVKDMFSGLDSLPALTGYSMKPLSGGTLSNPTGFLDANLSEFAASLKCVPRKILSGTQTGVKAADEDTQGFMRMMQSRRENTITPNGNKIIQWYDEYTQLRYPDGGASLEWDDLASPSKKEKIELMKAAVLANRDHILSGAVEPLLSDDQLRELGDFKRDENLEEYIDEEGN